MAKTDKTYQNIDIKESVVSGVKWSSVSQFGRQGIQLLTTVILARLLTPADFGLVGMAMVAINFLAVFKDLGTAAAVIQHKTLNQQLLSSVFWLNAGFGLTATIVLYLAAPLAAWAYGEPGVTSLLRALSFTFIISGLSILHLAVLQRNLAFGTVAKVELCAIAAGSVVGIGLAFMGAGVWSLVYQSLAMALVTTVLLWFCCPWRPTMTFGWDELKSVGSYSLNLTGFNIINYFSRNADYMLIGKYLGAKDLGYYTLAYRLMLYPLQNVSAVIGKVMFPVYSQIQDDDARFRHIYLKVVSTVATLTFPISMGLLALNKPFVTTVFGPQWAPVSLLLVILVPVGLLQSVGGMNGNIYTSKGRTDLQFRVGLVFTIITLTGFIVGLRWGIAGVAASYAVTTMILAYPSFAICLGLIKLKLTDLMNQLWRPLLSSLPMVSILYGLWHLIPARLDDKLTLGFLVAVGCLTYTAASFVINRKKALEVMSLLKLG